MKYELKTPDAPATFKQGITIRQLTGEDIRPRNLTMRQAHDIIQEALENGAVKKPFRPSNEKGRVSYSQMMKEATKAANAAGKAWLATAVPQFVVTDARSGRDLGYPPMLDVCGFVYITITDKRTSFARWIAKHQKDNTDMVVVPHHYRRRQEMGLKEACERAALDVFYKHGVTKGIQLFSRID